MASLLTRTQIGKMKAVRRIKAIEIPSKPRVQQALKREKDWRNWKVELLSTKYGKYSPSKSVKLWSKNVGVADEGFKSLTSHQIFSSENVH